MTVLNSEWHFVGFVEVIIEFIDLVLLYMWGCLCAHLISLSLSLSLIIIFHACSFCFWFINLFRLTECNSFIHHVIFYLNWLSEKLTNFLYQSASNEDVWWVFEESSKVLFSQNMLSKTVTADKLEILSELEKGSIWISFTSNPRWATRLIIDILHCLMFAGWFVAGTPYIFTAKRIFV